MRRLAALTAEGLRILLVEQNARAAFRIADRGYVLSPGGRIVPAARHAYGLALARGESKP
ncbi:MAG: hypothetical protein A3E31_16985 [Candidatus Rokubacteria bacterium RIFCSPHIGHO2_12_FULL_73_22]|nr:MAG: hypothetical protein A3D33_08910 [Candidatus Rokubacteria bacterium RIFCSPHIGHO2_02_FULL_73_26]OGL01872.1 MAG: hypothetical protein A3E31_16985 [Candidatus Rokubacteria bacterium RIFCSPHIGHO2_12_FULL_73_22]OGL08344.1 MAG: hypothetical protein A3I14_16060 [Candidatus Rokubacteria bacterium RIFCSPLOWO2_02_FULL_73_56]OGL30109.1 MAG: hypothetical protein A3G44_00470 [Candidatus Rokubacteria bacterium RIFCSPLOWO2_12_FULL_73_47]